MCMDLYVLFGLRTIGRVKQTDLIVIGPQAGLQKRKVGKWTNSGRERIFAYVT